MSRIADELTPHNVEAEEAVLGSLFIDPEAVFRVNAFLRASDFYIQRNAWVYEAILALVDRHEPIDFVTLCDELERNGQLTEVGGAAYITTLINAVPSAIHATTYARLVTDDATRRRLISAASEIVQLAYQRDRKIDEIVLRAQGIITTAATGRGHPLTRNITSVMSHVWQNADEYHRNPIPDGQVRHQDTGWPDLNKALGGWRPGLYIALAVPHLGKSWFVLHSAANVAQTGGRVLFFSLEMTATQLVERLCTSYARVSKYHYERGDMSPEQWARFTKRGGELADWNVTIDDKASSLSQICAIVCREHLKRPLDLVVIDYLGLMEVPKAENRNIQIGGITRRLKLLSRDVGVPILVPHQISDKQVDNRQDKRPRTSDGYESGHVSQDVDVILGLYRASKYDSSEPEHVLDVFNLKDRLGGGAGGHVQLFFSKYGEMRSLQLDDVEEEREEKEDDDEGLWWDD